MIARANRYFQQRFSQWLSRRLPPTRSITLNNKRLFIFPSRTGLGWFVLLVLSWLAATNYENNLVFGFACLMASLFVVAILATFATLSGLTVRFVRAVPAFAGEDALIEIALQQPKAGFREGLQLFFANSDSVLTAMSGVEELRIQIPVPTHRRGWMDPGRLIIDSFYPLGLLRVWTKLDLDIHCLVYPKPITDIPAAFTTVGKGDGPLLDSEGAEDFVGLNDYQQGDSLKRVAWKQYAREQGMYSKHYADPQDKDLWLDWEAFPNHDREARLCRLCGCLLQVLSTQNSYGLRLPGVEIVPGKGEQHRLRLLRELALFELTDASVRGESS